MLQRGRKDSVRTQKTLNVQDELSSSRFNQPIQYFDASDGLIIDAASGTSPSTAALAISLLDWIRSNLDLHQLQRSPLGRCISVIGK